jgi:hypothetical protein
MLFGLLDSADADEGAAAGFFRGHAVADVFFDGEIDVALKLGVEVGVALLLLEEGDAAVEGFAKGSHYRPPSVGMARTRPMTMARRFQYAVSFAHCLRPSLVMA